MVSTLYISRTGERVGSLQGNIAKAVADLYLPGGVASESAEGHFLAGSVEGLCDVFRSITPDTIVWAD